MANEYITLQELKHTAELASVTFADYDATMAIAAASRGIDEYCGRRFYPDTSATVVRYYTPQEPGYLNTHDIVTCSTVAIDLNGDGVFETTWTANTDYILEPLNAAADARPYESVRVHPASNQRFPIWPRSVAVTGKFGWAACPDTVKEATTIMSVRLLKRAREAPFGVVGLGLDNTAVRIAKVDPDVCFLLEPFVRGRGVLAA